VFEPQLGVSLTVITKEVTPKALATVAASRIATLEITPGLFEGDEGAKLAALKATLAGGSVRAASVHALFGGAYDLSVPDDERQAEAVASAKAAVDFATELGAPIAVFHASAEPIEPAERPKRLERAAAALSEIGSKCREAGVRAAVEILPRSCLCNTVEEATALLDTVGEDCFGVCLDTNHLMDRYRELPDCVRTLGERLTTLHLSDYDGVDEKHWLPGKGVNDWAAFVGALRDVGYGGPFNYECTPRPDPPAPPGPPGAQPPGLAERISALEENFEWLSGL